MILAKKSSLERLYIFIENSKGEKIKFKINDNQEIQGKIIDSFANINLEQGKFIVINLEIIKDKKCCDDGDGFGYYENEISKCNDCKQKLQIELLDLEKIEEITEKEELFDFKCGENKYKICIF